MNFSQYYQNLRRQLREAQVDDADLTARLFLKQATGEKDITKILDSTVPVPLAVADMIGGWVARRIAGEPVNRIFGEAEFHGLTFEVTPDVLDPRQDTETLVNIALERFKGREPERVLDLGTGSGAIIVALLHYWRAAKGMAVDVSPAALAVAKRNAERNNVSPRIAFVNGSWFDSVAGRFDLIVSNPPYIPNRDIANLQKEVREHDPILALDGGEDGMFSIRHIITQIGKHLSPGGICLMEIGFDQGENVARLVRESGLSHSAVHLDLSGVPRVVEFTTGEN
jgi:release factor glutamine methyltransferase